MQLKEIIYKFKTQKYRQGLIGDCVYL